jgi:hypothetical protein
MARCSGRGGRRISRLSISAGLNEGFAKLMLLRLYLNIPQFHQMSENNK